uniref:Uncharacterized protein n=1 Tax=uncultured Nocardioidaceae bacterium TaxID=253824 RepID=A0A6J4KMN8_9ACTN|nr:MAG: hypothetical protein AVDCRST_MAG46-29 [uncultured Nocardioidaceae bacterium]
MSSAVLAKASPSSTGLPARTSPSAANEVCLRRCRWFDALEGVLCPPIEGPMRTNGQRVKTLADQVSKSWHRR